MHSVIIGLTQLGAVKQLPEVFQSFVSMWLLELRWRTKIKLPLVLIPRARNFCIPRRFLVKYRISSLSNYTSIKSLSCNVCWGRRFTRMMQCRKNENVAWEEWGCYSFHSRNLFGFVVKLNRSGWPWPVLYFVFMTWICFPFVKVVEMEAILQEHNNTMPAREILVALAEKFRYLPYKKCENVYRRSMERIYLYLSFSFWIPIGFYECFILLTVALQREKGGCQCKWSK